MGVSTSRTGSGNQFQSVTNKCLRTPQASSRLCCWTVPNLCQCLDGQKNAPKPMPPHRQRKRGRWMVTIRMPGFLDAAKRSPIRARLAAEPARRREGRANNPPRSAAERRAERRRLAARAPRVTASQAAHTSSPEPTAAAGIAGTARRRNYASLLVAKFTLTESNDFFPAPGTPAGPSTR